MVVDAAGIIQVAAVAPIQPLLVSARCALRLKVTLIAYHYYTCIGRTPRAANMNYTIVLKDFYMEWKAIQMLFRPGPEQASDTIEVDGILP